MVNSVISDPNSIIIIHLIFNPYNVKVLA